MEAFATEAWAWAIGLPLGLFAFLYGFSLFVRAMDDAERREERWSWSDKSKIDFPTKDALIASKVAIRDLLSATPTPGLADQALRAIDKVLK